MINICPCNFMKHEKQISPFIKAPLNHTLTKIVQISDWVAGLQPTRIVAQSQHTVVDVAELKKEGKSTAQIKRNGSAAIPAHRRSLVVALIFGSVWPHPMVLSLGDLIKRRKTI